VPRAAVVVNPVSGSRRRGRALVRFVRRLEEGGYEVRLCTTTRAGEGAEIAAREADLGADVLVAAGGDGTLNEIASGVVDRADPPALALLPSGTSNLVARELGVPADPLRAADVVLHGNRFPMDAARAGQRLFLACLGVGLDAHVVGALTARRRGHISFHSYALPLLASLARRNFAPLTVTADGVVVPGVFALVMNARPYAAFLTPVPAARCDDGLLDVLVVRRGGPLSVPRWTFRSLRGTLGRDADVTVVRAARVRVEADVPAPWQVDGDVGGTTPVDIVVLPGAVTLLRPERGPA
jgi:diacylglycerol kinase (ATP)